MQSRAQSQQMHVICPSVGVDIGYTGGLLKIRDFDWAWYNGYRAYLGKDMQDAQLAYTQLL